MKKFKLDTEILKDEFFWERVFQSIARYFVIIFSVFIAGALLFSFLFYAPKTSLFVFTFMAVIFYLEYRKELKRKHGK